MDNQTYLKLERIFRKLYLQEKSAEVGPYWQEQVMHHIHQIAAQKSNSLDHFVKRFIMAATTAAIVLAIWLGMAPEYEIRELCLLEPFDFFWITSWWM